MLEGGRFGVGGGGGPVDVGAEEEVEGGVPGEERDLLRVEGAEEGRRAVRLEGLLAADGEDELGEERGEVAADAVLGLGPEQRLRFPQRRPRVLGLNAEIDVAKDAGAVERREQVGCDAVLQLLFADMGVVGHGCTIISLAMIDIHFT